MSMHPSFSLEAAWLGVVSFAVAWLGHVCLWRLFSPRHDVRALSVVLFLVPALALPWLARLGTAAVAPALVHCLLAANYLAVYPAIQASSPTLKLLLLLSRQPRGLTFEELESVFGETLVGDRVEDLKRGNLVGEQATGLRLQPAGRALAVFFLFYRRCLGLPEGEG